uniref:Core Histone H2A/H2B/H3 domain-containing protein n=1 Tax=Propithecus coquereli TaxID=379532 RepID=A0A2K6EX36_PROCO
AACAMGKPSSAASSDACLGAKEPQEAGSKTTQKQKQPRRSGNRPSHSGDSFATYFPRILNQAHVGLSLSQEALSVMDSFVHDILERIAEEAGRLARYTRRSTITSREIQTAVRLMLPRDIGKHAVSVGTNALIRRSVCVIWPLMK